MSPPLDIFYLCDNNERTFSFFQREAVFPEMKEPKRVPQRTFSFQKILLLVAVSRKNPAMSLLVVPLVSEALGADRQGAGPLGLQPRASEESALPGTVQARRARSPRASARRRHALRRRFEERTKAGAAYGGRERDCSPLSRSRRADVIVVPRRTHPLDRQEEGSRFFFYR